MSVPAGILDLYAFPAARESGMGSHVPVPTFGHAADAFILAHALPGAWSAGTAVKYRQTLAVRLAPAAAGDVAVLGTPGGAAALEAAFTASFGTLAAATRARHLAALRSAIAWWARTGWVAGNPTSGWARPKITPDARRR
jgi:site-specific recombinase XerC